MKFKIRYADQIVGIFIVLTLACLVFVVVMLGRSQRWFAKDVSFTTILPTAGGLNKNMPIQYRGFTIGNVKDFYLTVDDNVEVVFLINEEHKDRVRFGSMVEMVISPIGLGNQFLFHAGKGDILSEGTFIPAYGSARAREMIRQGMADEPRQEDSISVLMSRVGSVLDEVNKLLSLVNEALGEGTGSTEIGLIVGSLQKTLDGVETLPGTVEQTLGSAVGIVEQTLSSVVGIIDDLYAELLPVLTGVDVILSNFSDIAEELNKPDGFIYNILDTDKEVYNGLVSSLQSISSILGDLENIVAFFPGQLPQISALLVNLRSALVTADDVMTALTNNPLLRGGIPEKAESQAGGTSPRDIRF